MQRSSIFTEIAWLAFFFAVFVVCVYAFNIFVVPHHFNDKVAIVLSAIIAALVMMFVRFRSMRGRAGR